MRIFAERNAAILVTAIFILTATTASAFEGDVGPRQGAMEVSANASLDSSSGGGGSSTSTIIFANVGYLLTDSLKLGVGVILNASKPSGGETSGSTYILLDGTYYLAQAGNNFPFVSAQFGTITSEGYGSSRSSSTYGLSAGMAMYMTEDVSLKPELAFSSYDLGGSTYTTTSLRVGLSVLLGGR